MSNDIKSGDLLFLTGAFNAYFHKKHKNSKIVLTNRLAKLEEIIDWGSEKGKKIKAARIKSGKWKNLSIEENKYIISIFYHDLTGRGGQKGANGKPNQKPQSYFVNHKGILSHFFIINKRYFSLSAMNVKRRGKARQQPASLVFIKRNRFNPLNRYLFRRP